MIRRDAPQKDWLENKSTIPKERHAQYLPDYKK